MVKGFLWNCCTCTQDSIIATFSKSCPDCGHKICESCVYYRTSGYGTVLDQIQHVDLRNFMGSKKNERNGLRVDKKDDTARLLEYDIGKVGKVGKAGEQISGHWGHSPYNEGRSTSGQRKTPGGQTGGYGKAPEAAKTKPQSATTPNLPKTNTAQFTPSTPKSPYDPQASAPQHPVEKLKPLTFKDTLGRKFHFPFELCKTWKGMQGLINGACKGIETTEKMAKEGGYFLLGPAGDIILTQVWQMVVEPGWQVEMVGLPARESTPSVKNNDRDKVNGKQATVEDVEDEKEQDETGERLRIIRDVLATMRISEENRKRIMIVINEAVEDEEDIGW